MPIPRPVIQTDMVTDTSWGVRRTRFYWTADLQPTGISDLEAVCNRLMVVIATPWAAFITSQCKILRFEGRYFGSGTTGFEGNSTTAAIAGSHAAVTPGSDTEDEASSITDTLPDETSLIIQKRTGNTNRGSMGRWFFTGLTEKINNHGVIAKDYWGNTVAFANLLSQDVTITGSYATILHARHWNRKSNSLQPITKCYALKTLGTRLDRRNPLQLERL